MGCTTARRTCSTAGRRGSNRPAVACAAGIEGLFGQIGAGLGRVFLEQLLGLLGDFLLLGEEPLLQRAADGGHVVPHVAPAMGGDRGHALERPPRRPMAEAGRVAVGLEVLGQIGHAGVDRHVGGHRRIAVAQPNDAADRIGQPAARLRDRGIDAEEPRQAPLAVPAVGAAEPQHLVHFVGRERVGQRALDRLAGVVDDRQVLRHVEVGALERVAEQLHDLFRPDGLLRLDRERKEVAVRVQPQRRGQQVEHPPLPPRDREPVAAVGVIGLVEAERLAALRVPVAELFGDLKTLFEAMK